MRLRLRASCICLLIVAFARFDSSVAASGRTVTFSAPDGTTLAAILYEPSTRPTPGVVLVHMLGRSKDEWAPVAERLQQAGATVLAIDLRGHGASSGATAILPPMAADVRAAVEWLAARPGVRPGALAIVGASLGATLAALAASEMPAVRAVALISPSLEYRGLRIDAGVMKRLGDRPVWLASSTEDPYALRTIKELVAAGGPREQRLTTVRGHGTGLLLADPDLTGGLVDWLRRTLYIG
jgi:alpha-beta hydrolase superfamily lysophospholipase